MQTAPSTRHDPLEVPPHSPLTSYYERDRQDYVVDLFNRTAQHYDTIESLFLKGGLWYRRFGMKRAGMKPGMKVLDMATGTGAVARGAARIVGPSGRVFGCDPTPGHARAGEEGVHRPAHARRRRLAAVQERAASTS